MANVPNTSTFTFQDVTNAVYNDTAAGRNLSSAFTDATGTFDATYQGSKNQLDDFRNYKTYVFDGLILYLDAGSDNSYPNSGSTWYDLTSNGYDGTLQTGTSFSSSDGGSIVFDGSTGNVLHGDVLDMGTGDMTFIVWFKLATTSLTSQYLISKSFLGTGDYRYGFAVNNRQLRGLIQGNTPGSDVQVNSTTQLSSGTWYMGAMTIDRSASFKLWVNAVEQTLGASSTISQWDGLDFQSTYPFRVGSYTAADATSVYVPLNGNISIVQVYNRLLSSTELTQNFDAFKARYGI